MSNARIGIDMSKIYTPKSIDLSSFQLPDEKLQTKYGLPNKVEFCKSCVISNQRPNSAVEYEHKKESKKHTIHFDDEGICDACRVAERKKSTINWEERDRQLRELCDRFRSKDGS
ncbi:TPA: N-acetyl sugar amidotransferase, partial [Legionella pneumophila]|nr:N-acetyl sugar amidotransferase [Legionella pneumophila]